MPNVRQIRRRIRSVENTGKLTKAMEMVAAAKMRRAQAAVLATRPYAAKMQELLANLASMPNEDPSETHPLLRRRPVKKIALVQVTPDRGLCGGLVGNMNRSSGSFIVQNAAPFTVVTVGRKGRDFMVRVGRDVRATFTGLGERPVLADTTAVSRVVIDDYSSGFCDAVFLAYTQFVNTAVQRPVIRQLLPVQAAPTQPGQATDYIFEPRSLQLLSALLPRIVEMQVYSAVLESNASEQSARMVAMRNAADNAEDLARDLTLEANKARQASITTELLDIITGTLTLE
ncbi:MAG: ATP synthase F1 subunit gamma [Dehalococcoidia bacterium]|nr:ATP synthase F1 subunit gamma [Dehalococcoidia bacterium]